MPGLGKKTFTAGDVLIAGDVNNYLMDQTVMNFATTAARSSAIPVPSTGMVSYVGDTGSESPTSTIAQIEAYTGAAWQTPYGMTLLANSSINATSFILDNIFSSTYDTYRFSLELTTSTNAVAMQLRSGGTTTTTNYNVALMYGTSYSSGLTTAVNSTSSFHMAQGLPAGDYQHSIGDIANPFTATNTAFHGILPSNLPIFVIGRQNSNTQFTGLSLNSGGALMIGRLRIYGYRNS
jgi:hypothetical protein